MLYFPYARSVGKRNLNTSMTLMSTTYERLRADLLSGLWPPSQKLGIRTLASHYETGATPIREALNRLSAEGLVHHLNQRGFAVAPVSDDALSELAKTRIWVESLALEKSMASRSAEWEERLVVNLHRLTRTPRSLLEDAYSENPEWELRHRQLHMSLVGNCGSRWLISFCEQLYDQAYRYRQLAVNVAYKSRDVLTEHQVIVNAVLSGNTPAALAALEHHYQNTTAILLRGSVR
jgi:DNA-binding GntR family transcriptional regulator